MSIIIIITFSFLITMLKSNNFEPSSSEIKIKKGRKKHVKLDKEFHKEVDSHLKSENHRKLKKKVFIITKIKKDVCSQRNTANILNTIDSGSSMKISNIRIANNPSLIDKLFSIKEKYKNIIQTKIVI